MLIMAIMRVTTWVRIVGVINLLTKRQVSARKPEALYPKP